MKSSKSLGVSGGGPPRLRYGNPGCGRGPSDGYVQSDRDLLPSSPKSIALHRSEAPPSEPPGKAAASNSLDAICSGVHPHTNNRRPTCSRGLVVAEEHGRSAAVAVGQFGCQKKSEPR